MGRRFFWIHIHINFILPLWVIELIHVHQSFTSSTFRETERLGFCEKKKQKSNRLISFTNFNAQFLYSLKISTLHYNPRHVSSINMPFFRRTNCIITASGIATLCKRLYNMPDESRLCRACSHPE
jgi:hypothetical protein